MRQVKRAKQIWENLLEISQILLIAEERIWTLKPLSLNKPLVFHTLNAYSTNLNNSTGILIYKILPVETYQSSHHEVGPSRSWSLLLNPFLSSLISNWNHSLVLNYRPNLGYHCFLNSIVAEPHSLLSHYKIDHDWLMRVRAFLGIHHLHSRYPTKYYCNSQAPVYLQFF